MPFRKTVNNTSQSCLLNPNNQSILGPFLSHHSTSARTPPPLRHQDSTAPNPCPKLPYRTHPPAHPLTPELVPTPLPTAPQCHHPLAHPHQAPHLPRASSTSPPLPTSSNLASSSQHQKKPMKILLQKLCASSGHRQVRLVQLPPPRHRKACRT